MLYRGFKSLSPSTTVILRMLYEHAVYAWIVEAPDAATAEQLGEDLWSDDIDVLT